MAFSGDISGALTEALLVSAKATGKSVGVCVRTIGSVVNDSSFFLQGIVTPTETQKIRLGSEIARTVSTAKNGIRLSDIGKKLGVSWQSLVPMVKELVDAKKIVKRNKLYYSVITTPSDPFLE